MKTNIMKTSVAILALAVTGCTTNEAGTFNTSANFGNSGANNLLAQSAYLTSGVLAELSTNFRASTSDMINFEFNSADLDATAMSILNQQATWISENPAVKFRVYGHTDRVGSASYNQALGLRRARAVVDYLVQRGVPREKLQAVASYGETRPLIDTSNRERLNRRTVTEIIGFADGYVGDDLDGKVANRVYKGYVGDLPAHTGSNFGGG